MLLHVPVNNMFCSLLEKESKEKLSQIFSSKKSASKICIFIKSPFFQNSENSRVFILKITRQGPMAPVRATNILRYYNM